MQFLANFLYNFLLLIILFIFIAIVFEFFFVDIRPVFLSIAGLSPTFVEITGIPQATDSSITLGKPSLTEEIIKNLELFKSLRIFFWLQKPKKETFTEKIEEKEEPQPEVNTRALYTGKKQTLAKVKEKQLEMATREVKMAIQTQVHTLEVEVALMALLLT